MYIKSHPWAGRTDGKEKEHLRWHQIVKIENLTNISESYDYGILGFMCDEGVLRNMGRIGAKHGPEFLRKACSNFPYASSKTIADFGNIVCEDTNLEKAQESLGDAVCKIQILGTKTVVFGGGHEVMYGHYMGLRKAYPDKKIGIINVDAHFDNRTLVEGIGASSGTGFWQIAQIDTNYQYLAIGIQPNSNTKALFNEAHKTGTEYILAEEVNVENEGKIVKKLEGFLDLVDIVYLTLCLDVFAAPFAPGVSATSYNGIFPDYFFKKIFKPVFKTEKLIAFDIAELNPSFDIDNRTAKLAASLVFDYITINN
jgi:formiminoglutamase